MKLKLKEQCIDYLNNSDADAVAVGIINFKSKTIESIEFERAKNSILERVNGKIYFDLASVSKPLINSMAAFEHRKDLNSDLKLILNHRASIPAWGLLPKTGWKNQILSYPVIESETLYSDFSANRFMLELEKITGIKFKNTCEKTWDKELVYWSDLSSSFKFIQNGFIKGMANFGKVHDPNAYNLKEFTSHAGLFGTVGGVCRTLLNFNETYDLLNQMIVEISEDKFENRFIMGWDRVQDLEHSLAGKGCSKFTFGHLGFTGTSVWIDPEKQLGHVILTNSTKYYWFNKKNLPTFRRNIGKLVWQSL